MRDLILALLIVILFIAAFGGFWGMISLGVWITAGAYSHIDPQNPASSYWLVLTQRYKRHLIALFVLFAISIIAFISLFIRKKYLG